MSEREFRDDDPGYLAWIAEHPGGFVINIRRGHNPSDARLHLASCGWISGENSRRGPWTGQFVKVCADELAELEQWATDNVGGPITRCRTCRPGRDTATQNGLLRATRLSPTARGRASVKARADILRPEPNRPVVEIWSDDYVHFQDRSARQEQLRDDIRARVGQLVATEQEVLHATFFGPLPPRADVENFVRTLRPRRHCGGRLLERFDYRADIGLSLGIERSGQVHGAPDVVIVTPPSRGRRRPGSGATAPVSVAMPRWRRSR
jgi:hypothetical protein